MMIDELVSNRKDADFWCERLVCFYRGKNLVFLDIESNGDFVFNVIAFDGMVVSMSTMNKVSGSMCRVLEQKTIKELMR